LSCRLIYNPDLFRRNRRNRAGRPAVAYRALAAAILLSAFSYSAVFCQEYGPKVIPQERLVYPKTQLCLLDPRLNNAMIDPFDIQVFNRHLLAFLRSADYLTVKTQAEIETILARNRAEIPEVYDRKALDRICDLTGTEFASFMSLISCEIDRESGFSIPVLFHRNKVTFRAELDMALIDGKTGGLQYSQRVKAAQSQGRGIQVFPVTTDDPNLHLGFRQREKLAHLVMQDLARRTFEALIKGMHKPLVEKYMCYWQDEVHIISNKPGLCPICGSRLVKVVR